MASWSDGGGFVTHPVVDLGEGNFRCDSAPAGEYLVGMRQAPGMTDWVVTDSRVLNLDYIAAGPVSDAGVLPDTTFPVVFDGGSASGLSLALFSPDTSSRAWSTVDADGGAEHHVILAGFPSSNPDAVRSWAWSHYDDNSSAGGVSHDLVGIRGWTEVVGVPAGPVVALDLSADQPLRGTIRVPSDVFPSLADAGPTSLLRYSAILSVSADPDVGQLPGLVSESLWASLGSDSVLFMSTPTALDLEVVTQVPFRGTTWGTWWTTFVSTRVGGPGARASYSVTSASLPSSFEVLLSLPQDLRIDGVETTTPGLAFGSRHPHVSWRAPEKGVADGYVVFFNLDGFEARSTLRTRSTSVRLPPNFVAGRGSLRVMAVSSPEVPWLPHPPVDYARVSVAASVSSAVWSAPPGP